MSDNPLKSLDDEQIEGAAGGYLFDTYELEGGYSCLRKPFEVVDDKGEVIGRFWSSDDAKQFAKEKGLSTDWITLEQLQKLRETGSIS